jgi:uncharacterized protein (DUF1015 family)
VASRSYVTYTAAGLRWKLDSNPYSFIHIINPDYRVPGRKSRGKRRYQLVRDKFQEFCSNDVFRREDQASFYIYRQTFHGLTFTGIVGGASVEDYKNGRIKRHESTLLKREKMFRDYLDVCGFNAEPVLLTFPKKEGLADLLDSYIAQRPEYEFSSANGCLHEMWVIDNEDHIARIQAYFQSVDNLYIADGHHRVASSALLSDSYGKDKSLMNYFMAYFVPEDELTIWDYNRLVTNLNNHTPEEYLEKVLKEFELLHSSDEPLRPNAKHEISMYLNKRWYLLKYDDQKTVETDPVSDLDARILTQHILGPIHDITDVRHDSRVGFLSGLSGMRGLQEKVDSGKFEVAFGLYPVSFQQLKKVADAGMIMPPKSTYIEPKLRSGLLIYSFDDNDS